MKKAQLHPRNRHQLIDGKAYDFEQLCIYSPELTSYLKDNGHGTTSIDFADNQSVKQLNKALLLTYYGLQFWDIPDQFLCPPVPGRADYIHHIANLLTHSNKHAPLKSRKIKGLDIGTGANLIYPIIGSYEYHWRFVASDIATTSLKCAKQLIKANPRLTKCIKLRQQINENNIFLNVINTDDFFTFSMCNPPFHESAEQAAAGSQRKNKNLGSSDRPLNFGGQSNELWCNGGELKFVTSMVKESAQFPQQVLWFTSLISNKNNIKPLESELKKLNVKQIKVVDMGQGNKQSRFIAWSFFNNDEMFNRLNLTQ